MPQNHYTVGYHDAQQERHYICEYANVSYEDIKDANEDVTFLKEHPSFVDSCTNESGLDYLMGIGPMGR